MSEAEQLDEDEIVDNLVETSGEMKAVEEGLYNEEVVTEDFSFVTQDTFEWKVPTGAFDDENRPIKYPVTAAQTDREEVISALLSADDPDEALFQAVQACVIKPEELIIDAVGEKHARENWDAANYAFKRVLKFKLLLAHGVDGDFFDNYARMVPQSTIRQLRRSYTELQEHTESGRRSESAIRPPRETSPSPTTTSDDKITVHEPETSETPPSPPPQDSEASKPQST